MASDRKRLKVDRYDEATEMIDDRLIKFLDWMKIENIELSDKVIISKAGSCAGYGLLAINDIEPGHVLFTIPRDAILWQNNSSVKTVIASEIQNLQSKSGWMPILVTLICEYLNNNSRWKPYFDITPENYDALDHPMFWESSLLEELSGTDLRSCVETDFKNMREEFENVVIPFFKRHTDVANLNDVTFDLFKRLTAFVMAYSFTDTTHSNSADSSDEEDETEEIKVSFPPMMVPLADILNHVAKHNAELVFGQKCLTMYSTRTIKKGEEVFNTYGQLSNVDLLHMYGFAESYPNNHNDEVNIPVKLVFQEFEKLSTINKDRLAHLKSLNLLEEEPLIITFNGIFDLERLFKLLYLDEQSLKTYLDNDGWQSDDEDGDPFSKENLKTLPVAQKVLLARVAEQQLLQLKCIVDDDDEELINSPEKLGKMPSRNKWALYVRYGQKMLLKQFIQFLNI